MINNVILVGSICNELKLSTFNDYEVVTVTLRVQRPFKDMNTDSYKSDYIPITFWNAYARNICEYCEKGDIVGVKARLTRRATGIVNKNGFNEYVTEVIGERVAFINVKKSNELFRGMKDKSKEDADGYNEPTLEDLKKMVNDIESQEPNEEYFNQDIDDEYLEDEELEEVKKAEKPLKKKEKEKK